jgi:hypothetical protein
MKPLPKDHISFLVSKIYIGYSIASFFFNRGFGKVILEYDYSNKSLIIEGMNEEKIKA